MNDQDKIIDLRQSDEDEADFAHEYYKKAWVFDQYQDDRISLFRSVLFDLNLPAGYVVMFGTHNCKVFNTWCEQWGKERCLGFELYNEDRLNNVVVMDVRGLGDWCKTPISLCWNDVGSWERTPQARMYSYTWAKNNIVKGGYYLESGNDIAGWDLELDMLDNGFAVDKIILDGAYILYEKL